MPVSRWLLLGLALATLSTSPAGAQDDVKVLKNTLDKLLPGSEVDSLKATPIAGLYEVSVAGRIFYFTKDGAYMLRGDLIDVATRHNLTEDTRRGIRLTALDKLGETSMIVYSPENPKHTVTVFTDVDCPYCARFHREVPKLVEMGVKVRYAAFPRRGIPSENYDRMVSVWCAKDPQRAMTEAKEQRPIEAAKCENPVKEHFGQGHSLGVAGTPTLILDNGELVGGYVPYRRLVQMLEKG